jgi:PST family polysaccharide transporter
MASFLISLAMARLLTPNDFGIFAVAMAVTAFLMHVNDAGVIAAVVQWPGRLEDMAATAATVALGFSVAVYAGVFAIAPWFAQMASSPDAAGVIRVLAALILVDGINAVRSGAILRRFQQDKLTIANGIGFAVQAPLCILLAIGGAGAFSFAISQLTGAIVTGVFVFVFAKLPVEFGFDRAVARRLVRFGIPLAASLGIEAILLNADYVIVGRLLGGVLLGYYLLAYNVSNWVPGIVSAGIRYVSIAGFSRLAEEKDAALARGVHRTAPVLVTLVLPFTVLMSILAPQLVECLYGSTWAPSAGALRFLMILMAARVMISFAFDILTSAGATRATLWLNLGWAVVLIPALYLGTSHGGIQGTAATHAVVALLVALPLAVVLLERTGISLSEVLPPLRRPAIAAVLAGAACAATVSVAKTAGPWATLALAGGIGLAVYAAVAVPTTARRAVLARLTPASRTTRAALQPETAVPTEGAARGG